MAEAADEAMPAPTTADIVQDTADIFLKQVTG